MNFEMEVAILDMELNEKIRLLTLALKFGDASASELKKDIAILKKKKQRLFKEKIQMLDYSSVI